MSATTKAADPFGYRAARDLLRTLPEHVRRTRLALGLSQREACYRAGLASCTVSRVERGERMSVETAEALLASDVLVGTSACSTVSAQLGSGVLELLDGQPPGCARLAVHQDVPGVGPCELFRQFATHDVHRSARRVAVQDAQGFRSGLGVQRGRRHDASCQECVNELSPLHVESFHFHHLHKCLNDSCTIGRMDVAKKCFFGII